jgi:hypothetical protein
MEKTHSRLPHLPSLSDQSRDSMLPLAGLMAARVQMADGWTPKDRALKHGMKYSTIQVIPTEQTFSKCSKVSTRNNNILVCGRVHM